MPRIQAQWRKLLPLRVALQTVVMDEKQTQAFSPLNLPATGAALMAWRPMGGGGEMQLEVGWQAVPALFSWLASCGMRVTAFSMQPENQVLRLTLQLEAEDAP
ncbi:MAG TPA: pilus assembly protein PilO [Klebsiella sp.]